MPDSREYKEALHYLIHAYNLAAPDGNAQRAFVTLIHSNQSDGQSAREVLQHAAATLFNGLAYGNWPQ